MGLTCETSCCTTDKEVNTGAELSTGPNQEQDNYNPREMRGQVTKGNAQR